MALQYSAKPSNNSYNDRTPKMKVKKYDVQIPHKQSNPRTHLQSGIMSLQKVKLDTILENESSLPNIHNPGNVHYHRKLPSNHSIKDRDHKSMSPLQYGHNQSSKYLKQSIGKYYSQENSKYANNIHLHNAASHPTLGSQNGRTLHLCNSGNIAKKPKLFGGKHIEVAPTEDFRKKNLDTNSVRQFNSKYTISFLEGYHDTLLQKCVDILNIETDPFVLEHNVPGYYISYLPAQDRNKFVKSGISSLNNSLALTRATDTSMNGGDLSTTSKDISVNRSIESHDLRVSREVSQGFGQNSAFMNDRISTLSSRFSFGGLNLNLPKVNLEAFRNSLSFYKDYKEHGKFIFIKASYKNANIDFGFAEYRVEEFGRKRQALMSKFFIPRIYRKMHMTVPIVIQTINRMFDTENLEKLSIEMIIGPEKIHHDLQLAGFKLEKQYIKQEKKYKLYTARRVDFHEYMKQVLPEIMMGKQEVVKL